MQLEHFSATQEWLFWSFSRNSAWSQREKSTFTKNHSQLSEVSCLWDSKYSCSFSRILTTSVATRVFHQYWDFWSFIKKSVNAQCLYIPFLYFCFFFIVLYSVTYWIIFLKLGSYKIWTSEIICFWSPGLLGFISKLPEWTENIKLWFLIFLKKVKLYL